MKKSFILKAIVLIVGLLIFGGLIHFANYDPSPASEVNTLVEFSSARVVQVLEDNTFLDQDNPEIRYGQMLLQVKMTEGAYEGELLEANHFFTGLGSIYYTEGDRVSVRTNTIDGELFTADIYNPERREVLIGFVMVFLLALALIGGKRGVMSIIGLAFTIISIIFILIPLMLKGYPIILTTVVILTLITIATLVLLGGFSPKTITAILGCLIGVVSAAFFAGLAGSLTTISGFNMDDISLLLLWTEDLQLSGIFISSVLIASLGAVMDTAMSIASAMEEIKATDPEISASQLFKSGMNVGRDAIGTMSNTLILAFIGAALSMTMVIYASGAPFNQIINNDSIGIELIRGVAGSLGIVLTAPAVAFIGSKLFTKWK